MSRYRPTEPALTEADRDRLEEMAEAAAEDAWDRDPGHDVW
jgi:hypothetical protein